HTTLFRSGARARGAVLRPRYATLPIARTSGCRVRKRRREPVMDQLPDLRSDADVDALMARVRAQLVVSAPAPTPAAPASERSGNALRDFLTVQAEYASAMCH